MMLVCATRIKQNNIKGTIWVKTNALWKVASICMIYNIPQYRYQADDREITRVQNCQSLTICLLFFTFICSVKVKAIFQLFKLEMDQLRHIHEETYRWKSLRGNLASLEQNLTSIEEKNWPALKKIWPALKKSDQH